MRRAVGRGFGRGHIGREVDDELSFHIEMRARKLIAQGVAPEEARRRARERFGDVDRVRGPCIAMDLERERAMNRATLLADLRQDLAYGWRMLRRNAGVTTVVVLTLALGIGANTAIFTLVNAVLLRTLPVAAPDELVAIGDPSRTGGMSFSTSARSDLYSYVSYRELATGHEFLSGLAASGRMDRLDVLADSGATEAGHPRGRFVSGNYFRVLGVSALRGRTFDGTEDQTIGGAPAVVISHGYWMRRFAGDDGVVGRDILINGSRFSVIGVTPPWFSGEIVGRTTDVWLPISMQTVLYPNRPMLADPQAYWLLLLGRRKPGVTLDQAEAGLTQRIRQLLVRQATSAATAEGIDRMRTWVSSGAKGFSNVRVSYQAPLITLMVGVAVLLLIICANVANLLLARAVTRGREMSVRLAIGAGRARLVRQLMTEGAVLGLLGAAAGLVVARWGSRLLLALVADGGNVLPLDVALDLRVLAFTASLSVLAVALFALAPALRASRVDLASAMRASARALTGGVLGARGQRIPVGKLLISAQVALSLVLLVGTALLVRSLQNLQGSDTGLDRDHLLIADVDIYSRGYLGERLMQASRDLRERLARLPGVEAVSFSANGIFSGSESSNNVGVPGFVAHERTDSIVRYDEVGPGYANAIGARLLEGRDFTDADVRGTEPVLLVNQTFVRFYFGDVNPVGRVIRVNDSTHARIVGVVADVKDHSLTDAPVARYYVPYLQHLFGDPGALRLLVRTGGDPAALSIAVRRAVGDFDRDLPIDDLEPLSALMRDSVREERLLARLASGFGVMALLLAAVGLYGVMTYAITRRTGELGLRVALGAGRGTVIGMVVGDAMRLVALGVVVGVPLALAASRLLRNQLHGVGTTDPVSLTIALVVLGTCSVVAALLPAWRASRVAPVVALREDG
jgi:putative ABC transport system permease protein